MLLIWLGEGVIGELSLDLDIHSRMAINIKAWVVCFLFCLLIYTNIGSLSINACVNDLFILMLLDLLNGFHLIILIALLCFVMSLESCASIQML